MSGLAEETEALRERLRAIHDEARRNEAAFERLKQRELELLAAPTLADLLDALARRLPQADGLDAATLVLDDPQHELRHLLLAEGVAPAPSTVPGSGRTPPRTISCCFRSSRRSAASRCCR
jgi:uncharacterized protein YigA (DUF484 family)